VRPNTQIRSPDRTSAPAGADQDGRTFSLFQRFLTQEDKAMKQMPNRQIRIPGPPLHCVRNTCDKAGANPKEVRKMLQLLGKRAAIYELAHNLKDRPPKFR
jgi:hypothetical protein